jgi:putative flippase GtrA
MPALLRAFPRLPDVPRLPHLAVEIGRFMVTGGLSTLVSVSLFNFLVHGLYLTSNPWLADQPLSALVIANLVGMMVSYRLSRYWTFRHRPPVHADGGRTAFFLINLVTLPLAVGTLWFSRHILGLTDPLSDNLFGNVIGALIGQVARFYLFRRYVFRKPVTVSDMVHPQTLAHPAHRMAEQVPGSDDWAQNA